MSLEQTDFIRMAYIDGRPKRVNERVIDSQLTRLIGEHTRLIGIPPIKFLKLFNGSPERWLEKKEIKTASLRLQKLCADLDTKIIFANLPQLTPYLLLARNHMNLDIRFLIIAHSVGSEKWLKHWIALAPLIRKQDIVIAATQSCKTALVNLSSVYKQTVCIPLFIDCHNPVQRSLANKPFNILMIGRIEPVKNIHNAIKLTAELRKTFPEVRLIVAGEFTGRNKEEIDLYRLQIEKVMHGTNSFDIVQWVGPVEGEEKSQLLSSASLLLNLSTDPGETFGFNLIEAKTHGLPVVCTKWDGFMEVVNDEIDGLFVDCFWDRDLPEIDMDNALLCCSRILCNDSFRLQLSKGALQAAFYYDYKKVIPRIISEIRNADTHLISDTRRTEFEELQTANLINLKEFYSETVIQETSFVNNRYFSFFTEQNGIKHEEWMPIAKRFIHHFAGGKCND
ncbi:glycosyltransferase involved in cell wall biosynthesis [Paenibacillus intestini]|nr:glycosyltransferase involved in cell wall biosynthesis [Paenibacillus intestini]